MVFFRIFYQERRGFDKARNSNALLSNENRQTMLPCFFSTLRPRATVQKNNISVTVIWDIFSIFSLMSQDVSQ